MSIFMRLCSMGKDRLMARSPQTQPSESLTVDVVNVVADYEDVDPVSLPPLAETINPDALDTLFDATSEATNSETYVAIEYCGHTVKVYADNTISLE